MWLLYNHFIYIVNNPGGEGDYLHAGCGGVLQGGAVQQARHQVQAGVYGPQVGCSQQGGKRYGDRYIQISFLLFLLC